MCRLDTYTVVLICMPEIIRVAGPVGIRHRIDFNRRNSAVQDVKEEMD